MSTSSDALRPPRIPTSQTNKQIHCEKSPPMFYFYFLSIFPSSHIVRHRLLSHTQQTQHRRLSPYIRPHIATHTNTSSHARLPSKKYTTLPSCQHRNNPLAPLRAVARFGPAPACRHAGLVDCDAGNMFRIQLRSERPTSRTWNELPPPYEPLDGGLRCFFSQ